MKVHIFKSKFKDEWVAYIKDYDVYGFGHTPEDAWYNLHLYLEDTVDQYNKILNDMRDIKNHDSLLS